VLQAVHSDRSGRIVLAADYGAAALDGPVATALEGGIPLPSGARIVPLADREALGLDRQGRPRPLGHARWAVAAILAPDAVRTHLPACAPLPGAEPLEPLAYTAVAANERGELVVAAMRGEHQVHPPADAAIARAIADRLRAEPSNRLLRQLARCAREYACPAARNAFFGVGECALPIGAPKNDAAGPALALRRRDERAPLDPVAPRASVADIAAVAVRHLGAGGDGVSFGQACEGEPLAVPRTLVDAVVAVRAASSAGEIVLRTSASSGAAVGRAAEAGVDRFVVPLVSADAATYERVHRPVGFRWSDVHASLREVMARQVPLSIELLALPGLTDRAAEVEALVSLLGELPDGTELRIADLAADAYALLASLPRAGPTLGIAPALARVSTDASHVRRVA